MPTCCAIIKELVGEEHVKGAVAFRRDCLELITITNGALAEVPVLVPNQRQGAATGDTFYRLKRHLDVTTEGWAFAVLLGTPKVQKRIADNEKVCGESPLLTCPGYGELLQLLHDNAPDLSRARNMATMRIRDPAHPCDGSLGAFLPAGMRVPPEKESMLLWPPYGGVLLPLQHAEEEKRLRARAIAETVEPALAAVHALERQKRAKRTPEGLRPPPPVLGFVVAPAPSSMKGVVLVSPAGGAAPRGRTHRAAASGEPPALVAASPLSPLAAVADGAATAPLDGVIDLTRDDDDVGGGGVGAADGHSAGGGREEPHQRLVSRRAAERRARRPLDLAPHDGRARKARQRRVVEHGEHVVLELTRAAARPPAAGRAAA